MAIGELLDYIEGFWIEFSVSRPQAIETLSQSVKPKKIRDLSERPTGQLERSFYGRK